MWSADMVSGLLPVRLTIGFEPDATVLIGTLVLAAATAIAFSLVPGLRLARAQIVTTMRGNRTDGGRSRARSALVVGQVAMSVVLVSAASLFVTSLQRARAVDVGFDVERGLLNRMDMSNLGFGREEGQLFGLGLFFFIACCT